MKERPIIFSGEMVRAILDLHKTQTRRVITPRIYPTAIYEGCIDGQHQLYESREGLVYRRNCPFGVPGDHLYVREAFGYVWPEWCDNGLVEENGIARPITDEECDVVYRATDPDYVWANDEGEECTLWKPSIFMPKRLARIWLEVVSVRAERLQETSYDDILAEGWNVKTSEPFTDGTAGEDARAWFRALWDSLNAKRGHPWSANDWLWVIEFRRMQ